MNVRTRKAVASAVALSGAAITLAGAAVTAPGASAATACVNRQFGRSNTFQQCVLDEQVLLNDLYDIHFRGPNVRLATDGYYGPQTAGDVVAFNTNTDTPGGEITTVYTWQELCYDTWSHNFRGAYWRNAGCASAV